MFTKNSVNKVMEELKKSPGHFVSEAHLQTSFAMQAHKLFKDKYSYYLEYPIDEGQNSISLADLIIVDLYTKEKTHIEFKRKTKNGHGKTKVSLTTVDGLTFEPTSMLAQDLGRFDCWKDIERIENQILNKKCKNGFFIFLTNDDLYINNDGTPTFGCAFSMKEGIHKAGTKKWKKTVNINSIGKIRNRDIKINKDYDFKYSLFKDGIEKYSTTWLLVVEI